MRGDQHPPLPAAPSNGALAAYAGLGTPLAMMALPVYVLIPKFYNAATGLALSTIGAVLLGTRLLDAISDPLLGAWVDARRRGGSYLRPILIAMPPLALGFVLMFSPINGMSQSTAALWLAATLIAAYLGYSLATIAYQAWGAALAADDAERTRITAAREGAGLVGVILASVVPYALGAGSLIWIFCATLIIALAVLLKWAPPAAHLSDHKNLAEHSAGSFRNAGIPLQSSRFRWLLSVFVLNGIAAAIPATLVLFFIADRLELTPYSGVFLALYFIAGAASMALWAKLTQKRSIHAVWLAGMLASVVAFVWAYALGAGDFAGFATICVLSGAALGADLALPPALLARVIDEDGHRGLREGAYFGLWNFANKLNLAIAAGVALPLLAWLGYTPGSSNDSALHALSATYALVPCALKLAAAALLFAAWRGRRF